MSLASGEGQRANRKARAAGADQQLTASSRCGLDQANTKGINRSVQTKNHPIPGAVSTAVAIPITRLLHQFLVQ